MIQEGSAEFLIFKKMLKDAFLKEKTGVDMINIEAILMAFHSGQ